VVTGVTHIQMDATNHGGDNIINFNEIAFNTAAVPEPGTFGLALVGLTGIAVRRRRRRS
jgi:MYXO-CTERM domain-containing protein